MRIFFVVAGLICAAGAAAAPRPPGADMRTPEGVFERITAEVKAKDGVKEISYDQFMAIRASGEDFTLLDVLAADSFREGHIEGARNFPLETITAETVAKNLPKGARVIVYCGSFLCKASTTAAKKLGGFGYRVLDYKGGLKEWKDKGNQLAK